VGLTDRRYNKAAEALARLRAGPEGPSTPEGEYVTMNYGRTRRHRVTDDLSRVRATAGLKDFLLAESIKVFPVPPQPRDHDDRPEPKQRSRPVRSRAP
jgi:hypothetical protein